MLNLFEFSHDLKFQDGIWTALEIEKISYPDIGNKFCFEIEDQSFWFNYRNRIIYEIIKKHSISGPIFDIGGGNGFVSNYLIKLGFEAILVEPGIDGCLNGRERGLKNIINSNFDNAHFYSNSIPNICIFDVLEHVENHHQFLGMLYNNMTSNGRLFITVPAFNSLWSEEDKQAGHYRRYRTRDLFKLIDSFGFELLYTSYFFSFLVIPVFIFRTLPSILGLYEFSFKKSENQHYSNSYTNKLLDTLMKMELNKIKKNEKINIGSSLLVVARKR